MPANKLAESKRVAGEVGDGGQRSGRRTSAVRGQREPLASFYLFICYLMYFILHIFVFQRALFGVYAHFRFLYSIFINIFTECYDPTAGYQHTMLGPKGLWVQMN